MRLFLALTLDPELRRSLAQTSQDLSLSGGRVRWVPEDRLHLTLRFLGEVADSGLADVTEAVQEATREGTGFCLRVRGLGCFPPQPSTPRVLWAGIRSETGLDTLVEGLELELQIRGFLAERRPFTAHVTLARCQGKVRIATPLDPEAPDFGTQQVEAVTVMQSVLTPQGPRYASLAVVPLAGTGG